MPKGTSVNGGPTRSGDLPPPSFRRTGRSLTDEVRDALLQELVLSGAVPPGERMPTEAALCQRYGVSRITVRAALRSLQEAGYISVRQGQGSTVLPRAEAIASGLDQLCSFETFAGARVVETVDLEMEHVALDADEARRLERRPDDRALVTRRTKLYGGVRAGWIVDYVPEDVLAPSILREEFRGSVLDVLLAHDELDVAYSDCDLQPLPASPALAERLGVASGVPVLLMDELTRASDGTVLNWSKAWLLPEHFRFFIRRRRQMATR